MDGIQGYARADSHSHPIRTPLPPLLLRLRLTILGRGRDTAVRHVMNNHVISPLARDPRNGIPGSGVNRRPAVNTSKDGQPET